jgi:hypothetical protein
MLASTRRLAPPVSTAMSDIPARHELKYVIPEWQGDDVRRAIAPFCVPDAHARQDRGYAIHSLYLDTPTLALFRMAQERRASRWKARIRWYDDATSLFLELKRKDHDVVTKTRAVIPAAGWRDRLDAPLPADATPAERVFRDRLEHYQLLPSVMVRYQREAWLSTVDAYARVTFDRRIVCQPWQDWSLAADERSWLALDDARSLAGVTAGVLLELKCPRAVPRWLAQLTRSLGLRKARYSKYCRGVVRVGGRGDLYGVLDQS